MCNTCIHSSNHSEGKRAVFLLRSTEFLGLCLGTVKIREMFLETSLRHFHSKKCGFQTTYTNSVKVVYWNPGQLCGVSIKEM